MMIPQGTTAKFNLNVLSRINDELDADFNIENFSHYSIYNENDQRIENEFKISCISICNNCKI